MGKPRRYEKLVKLYIDAPTAELIESLPGSQSDAIRYLMKLGADKISLHHTDTANEVQKLSQVVITMYAELNKLKEAVAVLVKERGGL